MNIQPIQIDAVDLRKLLGTASGDAVLLYLYMRGGNEPQSACKDLGFSATRYTCASSTLQQLGLWPEEKRNYFMPGERPQYSEKDVLEAMDRESAFRLLRGEVQNLLGRNLNTEDLKILLGFLHYLGLPSEVVSVLVTYCKDRARRKGNLRSPSLRTIEKEAYFWAENGIDTLESAAAYIQSQNNRHTQMYQLLEVLQVRGRNLTPAEEKLANSWLEMGFDLEIIALAYERTCLNTGGLSWNYMNKILLRWKDAGFRTKQDILAGDRKGVDKTAPRQLDDDEKAAIAKLLQGV